MPRRQFDRIIASNLSVGDRFDFAGHECITITVRRSGAVGNHVINFVTARDVPGAVECSIIVPSTFPMATYKK